MVTRHYAVHPRKIGQRVNVGVKRIKEICAEAIGL